MIKWHKKAGHDLLSLVNYIAQDNPDAAQILRNEILTKINNLLAFPRIHKLGRVKNTRELVVRPNYIVIYTENKSTITIRRILHTARQWP